MYIEKLLDKLIKRELSEGEMKILEAYFQEKSPSEDMNRYFFGVWDRCHKYNADLDADLMLHQIHESLSFGPDIRKQGKIVSLFPGFLKYAAIFILAFSLSWLLNNQYNKQFKISQKNSTGVHEVTASLGSKSKIKLSDGSVVTLNSGSRLSYPAVFNDENRQVNLEGEAYFEVKADSSRPFFVNTSDIFVRVTGTSFNVKSYPVSNTIETTLVSGSLEVSDNSFVRRNVDRTNKPIILKPNQKAIYIKDRHKLSRDDRKELQIGAGQMDVPKLSMQDQIDTQSLTAWKDDKLVFEEEKFEDLAIKLERWYNVKFIIKSKELKNERFTGTFENETTEQILNALMIAEPFEYEMDRNIITIYDSGSKPE